jgi:hypothetical protein
MRVNIPLIRFAPGNLRLCLITMLFVVCARALQSGAAAAAVVGDCGYN